MQRFLSSEEWEIRRAFEKAAISKDLDTLDSLFDRYRADQPKLPNILTYDRNTAQHFFPPLLHHVLVNIAVENYPRVFSMFKKNGIPIRGSGASEWIMDRSFPEGGGVVVSWTRKTHYEFIRDIRRLASFVHYVEEAPPVWVMLRMVQATTNPRSFFFLNAAEEEQICAEYLAVVDRILFLWSEFPVTDEIPTEDLDNLFKHFITLTETKGDERWIKLVHWFVTSLCKIEQQKYVRNYPHKTPHDRAALFFALLLGHLYKLKKPSFELLQITFEQVKEIIGSEVYSAFACSVEFALKDFTAFSNSFKIKLRGDLQRIDPSNDGNKYLKAFMSSLIPFLNAWRLDLRFVEKEWHRCPYHVPDYISVIYHAYGSSHITYKDCPALKIVTENKSYEEILTAVWTVAIAPYYICSMTPRSIWNRLRWIIFELLLIRSYGENTVLNLVPIEIMVPIFISIVERD